MKIPLLLDGTWRHEMKHETTRTLIKVLLLRLNLESRSSHTRGSSRHPRCSGPLCILAQASFATLKASFRLMAFPPLFGCHRLSGKFLQISFVSSLVAIPSVSSTS